MFPNDFFRHMLRDNGLPLFHINQGNILNILCQYVEFRQSSRVLTNISAQKLRESKGVCAGLSTYFTQRIIAFVNRGTDKMLAFRILSLLKDCEEGTRTFADLTHEEVDALDQFVYLVSEHQDNQLNIESGAIFDNPQDKPQLQEQITLPFSQEELKQELLHLLLDVDNNGVVYICNRNHANIFWYENNEFYFFDPNVGVIKCSYDNLDTLCGFLYKQLFLTGMPKEVSEDAAEHLLGQGERQTLSLAMFSSSSKPCAYSEQNVKRVFSYVVPKLMEVGPAASYSSPILAAIVAGDSACLKLYRENPELDFLWTMHDDLTNFRDKVSYINAALQSENIGVITELLQHKFFNNDECKKIAYILALRKKEYVIAAILSPLINFSEREIRFGLGDTREERNISLRLMSLIGMTHGINTFLDSIPNISTRQKNKVLNQLLSCAINSENADRTLQFLSEELQYSCRYSKSSLDFISQVVAAKDNKELRELLSQARLQQERLERERQERENRERQEREELERRKQEENKAQAREERLGILYSRILNSEFDGKAEIVRKIQGDTPLTDEDIIRIENLLNGQERERQEQERIARERLEQKRKLETLYSQVVNLEIFEGKEKIISRINNIFSGLEPIDDEGITVIKQQVDGEKNRQEQQQKKRQSKHFWFCIALSFTFVGAISWLWYKKDYHAYKKLDMTRYGFHSPVYVGTALELGSKASVKEDYHSGTSMHSSSLPRTPTKF